MDVIDPDGSQTLALRAVAMPKYANPSGDIFGGWLLSQMDIAGGTNSTKGRPDHLERSSSTSDDGDKSEGCRPACSSKRRLVSPCDPAEQISA